MYVEFTKRAAHKLSRELEAQGYEVIVSREMRYRTTSRGQRRARAYIIHCRYIGC